MYKKNKMILLLITWLMFQSQQATAALITFDFTSDSASDSMTVAGITLDSSALRDNVSSGVDLFFDADYGLGVANGAGSGTNKNTLQSKNGETETLIFSLSRQFSSIQAINFPTVNPGKFFGDDVLNFNFSNHLTASVTPVDYSKQAQLTGNAVLPSFAISEADLGNRLFSTFSVTPSSEDRVFISSLTFDVPVENVSEPAMGLLFMMSCLTMFYINRRKQYRG